MAGKPASTYGRDNAAASRPLEVFDASAYLPWFTVCAASASALSDDELGFQDASSTSAAVVTRRILSAVARKTLERNLSRIQFILKARKAAQNEHSRLRKAIRYADPSMTLRKRAS